MKRIERKNNGKGASSRILKAIGICSMLLVVIFNNIQVVEGNYSLKEQTQITFEELVSIRIHCILNDLAYIVKYNVSESPTDFCSMQIIDINHPEIPIKLGKYVLEEQEILLQLKVRNNIAYLLKTQSYMGVSNWTLGFLDVSDPTKPSLLSNYRLENKTDSVGFTLNDDYLYLITDYGLEIINCSNPEVPVRIALIALPVGSIYVNNNYLYLISDYVRIYNLTNPINPIFIGEVKQSKHSGVRVGFFGNYIVAAFYWSGLQIYNCTDPTHPTICGHYEFSQREFASGGQIHDVELHSERLFAAGREVYIFDLSNPKKPIRVARKNTGDQDVEGIALTGNYIYASTWNTIHVYVFEEIALWRNIGFGIGFFILLPATVIVTIRIWKKKKN